LNQADDLPAFDTEGPVQAEVFVLRLNGSALELTGPCGAGPWYMQVGGDEDPVQVVGRLSRNLMGAPLLVHSTSWRRARGSVILTFIVVNRDEGAPELPGIPVHRAELARSGATDAPAAITYQQVLEHGLRHLAWLIGDDFTVRSVLGEEWTRALAGFTPEPFRHVG
jgi:hypothetical protein